MMTRWLPIVSRSIFLLLSMAVGLLWNVACGGGSSGNPPPPPAKLPPTMAMVFGAANVPLNGSTSLTFNLSNPNTALSLSGIGFTGTLPAGLAISTPNGLTGSCGGGTITAVAASGSVSLAGTTLAASASCSFTANVTATSTGVQNTTTSAVTSTEGGNGASASASITVVGPSQQPPQATDITPVNGEVYYMLNQLSGLQADLNSNSTTGGDHIVQQLQTFTNTSQRWIFTHSGGFWQISNVRNSLCLESAGGLVVQNSCGGSNAQLWTLAPTNSGYYTITNLATNLVIDVPSVSGGASLDQTALSGNATPSQQWLLRPAFFRGVDNALLEKQEAARISTGLVWWKDGGVQKDVLEILKNHGINMVRVRPSSAPPYANPSQAGCAGNLCYAETEAQDLDLAKRTKNLGMSLQLTLLFDGGNSSSVPAAWAGHTLSQLQTDLYNYVKAAIMAYRQAGTMPDLVAIGNEVDTGFLGSLGSPTGANFGGFASLQKQALQAVKDAAADTSIGPAIPAPLTCIHITPAWDLTDFFTLANTNDIEYDAICQSYYPIFHGPLTAAQAATSNPNNKPVEQNVLTTAAINMGKPIFIMEAGEHYENGFQANDPWYAPPSPALQRQFLLDLDTVVKGLPNNLGMGFAYWNPAGVAIPKVGGGLVNGDDGSDAIYVWNGLTLFDNADSSGTTNVNAANYAELLSGLDALGGKFVSPGP